MAGIKDYSTTPASNTALFPEGMARATVNDSSRQVQADIRSWYETAEWVDYGYTPTYASTTSFTMSGDRTSFFLVGRRIRMTDATTLYGTIATSSFGGGNTTVTVTMDSGSLSVSLTAVALGVVSIPTGGTGSSIGALGNVTGQASSVDSEIALFSGTGGKTIKRATGTGYVKVTSGVIGTPAATVPLTDIATQAANTVLANATAGTAAPTAVALSASTVLGRDASGNISALTLGGGLTATSGVLSQTGRVRISSTTYTTNTTLSTTIPADNTIPQITEGSEILSLSFTPVSASSTLLIQWYVYSAADSGAGATAAALFVDSTANALDTASSTTVGANLINVIAGAYTVSAASTSARTYRVRIGANAGNVYPNGTGGAARLYGGVSACKLIVTEILP